MKATSLFWALLVFGSCQAQQDKSLNKNNKETSTGEFNLADTTYFVAVKQYIKENGKVSSVNASSSLSDTMMVTYHSIMLNDVQVTVDHSDRIYMSIHNEHIGNILKENGTIKPEINYGVVDLNPQETKQRETKVLELYRQMIVLTLQKID